MHNDDDDGEDDDDGDNKKNFFYSITIKWPTEMHLMDFSFLTIASILTLYKL